MEKVLITGASGFIGSFMVEHALAQGMEVWAGMRRTSSKAYLTDTRIRFVELDFNSPDVLRSQLEQCKTEFGEWDYIIHAAGATKCRRPEDFFRTNTEGTKHFVDTLIALNMAPKRFVFISSLSVFGAVREKAVRKATPDNPWVYAPISDTDTPRPNTAYGQSKLLAEQYLKMLPADFPYVILRPTGVYGPREKDYFLMAQSIAQHVDFAVGYRPQEITFVYVKDLVQCAFRALTEPKGLRRAYFVSDGEVYGSTQFSDLLRKELGNLWMLRIKAPVWLLWILCTVIGGIAARLGHPATLNADKYHILRQRNWQCDIEPARRDLGYRPEYPLARGVAEAVAWYKKEGWL